MSTTASGILIIMAAVLLDWGGIGPSSIRDRIAFVFAAVGSHALWADTSVVDTAAGALRALVSALMGALGADAGPNDAALLVSAAVALLAVYGVLALWPDGAPDERTRVHADGTIETVHPRSGAARALASRVTLKCTPGRRINPRVWLIGAPLGALAPLAGGLVGDALNGALAVAPALLSSAVTALFVGGA